MNILDQFIIKWSGKYLLMYLLRTLKMLKYENVIDVLFLFMLYAICDNYLILRNH